MSGALATHSLPSTIRLESIYCYWICTGSGSGLVFANHCKAGAWEPVTLCMPTTDKIGAARESSLARGPADRATVQGG